jgi:hypothetical protein
MLAFDLIKTCSAEDWTGLASRADVRQIKVASSGFRGQDRKALEAVAPAEFVDYVSKLAWLPGEIPTHQIALGATEKWGANRNGDGFNRIDCLANYRSFVKHAKLFREHDNKPTSLFYGVVKHAYYCPEMDRIHLLGVLNGTKEAAERHGPLARVADEEMADLEKHGFYPTSMACKLPYDVCSWCEKKAKNRTEYCTASTCEAGGCRDNLGKIVKVAGDYHHLHVKNPNSTWFDNSKVWRGADPTAFATAASWLKAAFEKAASALGDYEAKTLEVAELYLAAARDPAGVALDLAPAFDPRLHKVAGVDLGPAGTSPFRRRLAALADAGVVLSFPTSARPPAKRNSPGPRRSSSSARRWRRPTSPHA